MSLELQRTVRVDFVGGFLTAARELFEEEKIIGRCDGAEIRIRVAPDILCYVDPLGLA